MCGVGPVIGLQSSLGRRKTKVKRKELGRGERPTPPPIPPLCTLTQAWKRGQPLACRGSVCVKGDSDRCWTQGDLHPKSACRASGN